MKLANLFSQIKSGDRVTIVNRFGQKMSGRAVMRGPAGWVLNMGGPHGTPGIADERNVVQVSHGRSGMETMIASELVKVARDLVAIPTRKYHQGCEGEISREVVLTGKSSGWIAEAGDRTWGIAQQAERRLSNFNIGYVDDMFGEWGLIRGGTKFFQ
jgi:hypothetical protein